MSLGLVALASFDFHFACSSGSYGADGGTFSVGPIIGNERRCHEVGEQADANSASLRRRIGRQDTTNLVYAAKGARHAGRLYGQGKE